MSCRRFASNKNDMNDPRYEPNYQTIYTCLLCGINELDTLPQDGNCVCNECREYDEDWKEYFDNLNDKEPNERDEDINGPDVMDLYKAALDR